ncbi:hypothetical protein BKA65DRAFT_582382 [Rhexocercosporidium sp. MPI-PUGE-AT-0058]|nr:hypothetical protein BKA65DRAFT_582382 [Rhexocercosporidium sp. MPI-PUGE-AT-0058]
MKLSIIGNLLSIVVLASGLVTVRSPSTEAQNRRGLASLTSKFINRDSEAELVGLVKRDKKCDIVHVATWVGCWWLPSKTASGTYKVAEIDGDVKNIPFECYTRCKATAIEGISAWYFTRKYTLPGRYYGCYVPGYYTDDNCRSTGSGHLPECDWHEGDEKDAKCKN